MTSNFDILVGVSVADMVGHSETGSEFRLRKKKKNFQSAHFQRGMTLIITKASPALDEYFFQLDASDSFVSHIRCGQWGCIQ